MHIKHVEPETLAGIIDGLESPSSTTYTTANDEWPAKATSTVWANDQPLPAR